MHSKLACSHALESCSFHDSVDRRCGSLGHVKIQNAGHHRRATQVIGALNFWSNGVAVKYNESVVPLIFSLEEVEQATTPYRDGADEFADPEVYDEYEIEEAMPVIHFMR